MKRRVYIAYTGGTIGMQPTSEGYAPAAGYLADQMATMAELHDRRAPVYDIHEYVPLLPSSAMGPADWTSIADDIAAQYDAYDGFVVLHGTDTMAFTASALAFRLRGLAKPVILTGSQIPLYEIRNDAHSNLITALLLAADPGLREVAICFGSKLLRGCRATKVDSNSLDAFDSPNCSPLARIGVHIQFDHAQGVHATAGPFALARRVVEPEVAIFWLFPGITAERLRRMLLPPLQGLVLQVYGSGSAPDRDPALLDVIAEATARGVVIVAVSQCLGGAVDLNAYTANSVLLKAGVVGGQDMTTEAALCKLDYLLAAGYDPPTVRRLMSENLCGELTP